MRVNDKPMSRARVILFKAADSAVLSTYATRMYLLGVLKLMLLMLCKYTLHKRGVLFKAVDTAVYQPIPHERTRGAVFL
jgi:hypothetical protein